MIATIDSVPHRNKERKNDLPYFTVAPEGTRARFLVIDLRGALRLSRQCGDISDDGFPRFYEPLLIF
jgi:hypothetical protein